jgi:hypothetical protein
MHYQIRLAVRQPLAAVELRHDRSLPWARVRASRIVTIGARHVLVHAAWHEVQVENVTGLTSPEIASHHRDNIAPAADLAQLDWRLDRALA